MASAYRSSPISTLIGDPITKKSWDLMIFLIMTTTRSWCKSFLTMIMTGPRWMLSGCCRGLHAMMLGAHQLLVQVAIGIASWSKTWCWTSKDLNTFWTQKSLFFQNRRKPLKWPKLHFGGRRTKKLAEGRLRAFYFRLVYRFNQALIKKRQLGFLASSE